MGDSEAPHSVGCPVANIVRGLKMFPSPKSYDSINKTPDPRQANPKNSGQRHLIRSIPRDRCSKPVQLTQHARRAKHNSLSSGEDCDELEKAFKDMSGHSGNNSGGNRERPITDIEDHGRIGAGSIPSIRKAGSAIGLGVIIPLDSDAELGIERMMDVQLGSHNHRQSALAAHTASRDDCPLTPSLSGSSSSFDSENDNESHRARFQRLRYGKIDLPNTPRERFQLETPPLPSITRYAKFAFDSISPSPSPPQTPRLSYSQRYSNNKSERPPLPVATLPRVRQRVPRESFSALQVTQQRAVIQDFASWLHHQECRSARRTAARAAKERGNGKIRLCNRRSINIPPIDTAICTSTHWSIAKIGQVDDIDFSTPGWTCGLNGTDRIRVVLILQGANGIGCDCPSNMSDKRSDNVEVGTCREDEDWSDDEGFFDGGKEGAEEQERMWVTLDRMRRYQDYATRLGKNSC